MAYIYIFIFIFIFIFIYIYFKNWKMMENHPDCCFPRTNRSNAQPLWFLGVFGKGFSVSLEGEGIRATENGTLLHACAANHKQPGGHCTVRPKKLWQTHDFGGKTVVFVGKIMAWNADSTQFLLVQAECLLIKLYFSPIKIQFWWANMGNSMF